MIWNMIKNICYTNNIREKQFVLQFISYIIKNNSDIISSTFLTSVEYIIHNSFTRESYLIHFLLKELTLYKLL